MLSFKRFLYIILVVVLLGLILLLFTIGRTGGLQLRNTPAPDREFLPAGQVDPGEKPRVWLLGDPEDGRWGEVYRNVRQLCQDLRLPVAGEGTLDADRARERDLAIFCSPDVGSYKDPAELEAFVAGGGRAILAAGLDEGEGDARLRQALGIREISAGTDCHDLVFEKPLLPLQPERAYYDGNSGSALIRVSGGASVCLRDGESGVPLLYTHQWQKGSVCLINGSFLADVRCMGLLTGAVSALLPDLVYPVLGVKAVFLDNFPTVTAAGDQVCRRVYGYSGEGFLRDVVWPAFQGISLRTDTPYTAGILAAASSGEDFDTGDGGLLAEAGGSVLRLGGELAFGADCPEEGKPVFDEALLRRFSAAFPSYTVRGLCLEGDGLSQALPEIPGGETRFVRGELGSPDARLSWQEDLTVFPAATRGSSMEDGNLFAVCSVLGAYGMVSHVFDVDTLFSGDQGAAAWDLENRQIGLFESEVLDRAPWLEARTLSRTGDDVRSYQELDYGWAREGDLLELDCAGAVKGQAFLYHTDRTAAGAQGLDCQSIGNGWYLLRIREGHGTVTLKGGE